MAEWLDEFNKVLEGKGVYVKAFTLKQMGNEGSFVDEFYKCTQLSIICFGLDRLEIDRLKKEPVLQYGNGGDECTGWGCRCCPAHEGRVI